MSHCRLQASLKLCDPTSQNVLVPMQAASPHQPQPPSSWILATVNLTKLQPEDIFRKPAYRRHLLQDSSAGISSGDSSSFDAGGNNNNAGAQCSGTGNLCQNTPTTVNNNQAITVYQYLPPSKLLLCVYTTPSMATASMP